MKKKISSSTFLILFAGIIAVGIIALVVTSKTSPVGAEELAQCLSDNGTKMYGAWWCPNCENQKDLFGNAFNKIESIECSPGGTKTMSAECKNEGIEGYPTWEFGDGTRVIGTQTFAQLADKAGCELQTE